MNYLLWATVERLAVDDAGGAAVPEHVSLDGIHHDGTAPGDGERLVDAHHISQYLTAVLRAHQQLLREEPRS